MPEQVMEILAMTSRSLAYPECTSCAVVGGARQLLLERASGLSIDAHECVFRLNRGISMFDFRDRARFVGTRTTHYFFYCCHEHGEKHRLSHTHAADWFFLPTTSHGTKWAVSALRNMTMGHDSLSIVDPVFVSQVSLMAEIDSKPLSGTVVVAAALQICTGPLDLYGFDTLNADYAALAHDPVQDHRWLLELEGQGSVRIHGRDHSR